MFQKLRQHQPVGSMKQLNLLTFWIFNTSLVCLYQSMVTSTYVQYLLNYKEKKMPAFFLGHWWRHKWAAKTCMDTQFTDLTLNEDISWIKIFFTEISFLWALDLFSPSNPFKGNLYSLCQWGALSQNYPNKGWQFINLLHIHFSW